jgi:hypothetical protein
MAHGPHALASSGQVLPDRLAERIEISAKSWSEWQAFSYFLSYSQSIILLQSITACRTEKLPHPFQQRLTIRQRPEASPTCCYLPWLPFFRPNDLCMMKPTSKPHTKLLLFRRLNLPRSISASALRTTERQILRWHKTKSKKNDGFITDKKRAQHNGGNIADR